MSLIFKKIENRNIFTQDFSPFEFLNCNMKLNTCYLR